MGWWARQDLNLEPVGYEPVTLPLSYGPTTVWWRRRGSNPHGGFPPVGFKSTASAISPLRHTFVLVGTHALRDPAVVAPRAGDVDLVVRGVALLRAALRVWRRSTAARHEHRFREGVDWRALRQLCESGHQLPARLFRKAPEGHGGLSEGIPEVALDFVPELREGGADLELLLNRLALLVVAAMTSGFFVVDVPVCVVVPQKLVHLDSLT